MNINALGTNQAIQAFDVTQMPSGPPPGPPPQEGVEGDTLTIGKSGKMMNMVSSMSEEDKAEMDAFLQEMQEAVKSGTFDAAKMAEKAPEGLQAFAEENGIDLEEMITAMAEGKRPPGGPPVEFYNSNGSGISNFDQDQTTELISRLFANDNSET